MNPKVPFGADLLSTLAPIILVFAILYFFLIRPQQKKNKQHISMINNIKSGDSVITTSGMIGVIKKIIDEKELELEISSGVSIRLLKGHVASLLSNVKVSDQNKTRKSLNSSNDSLTKRSSSPRNNRSDRSDRPNRKNEKSTSERSRVERPRSDRSNSSDTKRGNTIRDESASKKASSGGSENSSTEANNQSNNSNTNNANSRNSQNHNLDSKHDKINAEAHKSPEKSRGDKNDKGGSRARFTKPRKDSDKSFDKEMSI